MNKFEKYLEHYRETVANDSRKARKYIQKLDYHENFYLLRCIAQTYLDECRFEGQTNAMRKQIDLRKWRLAEKYIIQAFKINSNNGEVLYTMGEIRKVNFQNDIAIYCFEKIIRLGARMISKQEYSRGMDFAKELVNDARFELYRLYYFDNKKLSNMYLRQYKKYIQQGIATLYMPLNKYLVRQ